MTPDELTRLIVAVVVALFGGGGIWAGVTALSNRRIGIKTTENDANKTINTTWEAIVDDLQAQIRDGRDEFTRQLTAVNERVSRLQTALEDKDKQIYARDRLILTAIGHIGKLELLVPPNPVPDRPEGL